MNEQRYFCHICSREVTLSGRRDEPTCPICNQGFLEERNDDAELPSPLQGQFFLPREGATPLGGPVAQLLSQMFGLGSPVGAVDRSDESDGLYGAAEHGQAYGQARQSNAPTPGDEIPVRNLADFLSSAFGTSPNQPAAREAPEPPANPIMRLFQSLGGAPPMGNGQEFMFAFGGAGNGQFGDYATESGFNDLVTQLFEQAQGNYGPRPLTAEAIEELPKVTISKELLGSPSITDCAICKDEYVEGDETLKLPCKHLMHSDCIKPWLLQSGTCPVCRYQLVPQPTSHTPGPHARQQSSADEGSTLHEETAASPDHAMMPGAFPQAFVRFFAPPPAAPASRPSPPRDFQPDIDDLD